MSHDASSMPSASELAANVATGATVWVCGACGKIARHRWRGGIDAMWDESCAMNSVLCHYPPQLRPGFDGDPANPGRYGVLWMPVEPRQ